MTKTILAISIILGTMIGAGIYGIPYIVMKSGLIIGIAQIILIALIIAITTLYLGEITLRTKGNHHLVGYAEKYLGSKGKILMTISIIFGIYSAVLAYLIGISESLSFLIYNNPHHSLKLGIFFWLLMSIFSYSGIKALKNGEFIGVSTVLIFIISISAFFANKIDFDNLIYSNNLNQLNVLMPFGVILFAFLSYSIIPEVKNILGDYKKNMKKSIIFAVIIAALIYILFAIIVIGLQGTNTPKIATLSLGKPFILLGIITMFNAYLALSISLIDTLNLDFNQTKFKSWILTIFMPLILFIILSFTNSKDFTKVIGLGGVISGGLISILILNIVDRAKILGNRHPEYSISTSKILNYILILIFILGTILEITSFFQ